MIQFILWRESPLPCEYCLLHRLQICFLSLWILLICSWAYFFVLNSLWQYMHVNFWRCFGLHGSVAESNIWLFLECVCFALMWFKRDFFLMYILLQRRQVYRCSQLCRVSECLCLNGWWHLSHIHGVFEWVFKWTSRAFLLQYALLQIWHEYGL